MEVIPTGKGTARISLASTAGQRPGNGGIATIERGRMTPTDLLILVLIVVLFVVLLDRTK